MKSKLFIYFFSLFFNLLIKQFLFFFFINFRVIAICTRGHIKFFSISNFHLGQFKPLAFLNERRFSAQPINCIKWSDDGNLLVSGGEDQMIRVFPQKRFYFSNISCVMISQGRPIVGVYFCKNSYNVIFFLFIYKVYN